MGASWDVWTQQSAVVVSGLDQGATQSIFGSLGVTGSSVSTDILQAYDNESFTGLGFNSSTYYVHNGAFQWNGLLSISEAVTFARVSYALVGGGPGGALVGFENAPSIAGASLLASGSYDTTESTVFYYDFALSSASASLQSSFGDVVTPGFYPGSFRSLDAIQIEGLDVAPTVIPEPSSLLLSFLAGLTALARRRR